MRSNQTDKTVVWRRNLLALAAGIAATGPLVAAAQSKIPTIGVLVVDSPGAEPFWRGLREALRELGYIEGQNIRYEFRSDRGMAARLPELAAELVALKADVIVTWFTPATVAAKQATRQIPIVMGTAGNPVETGLVESLARPGGNVTGLAAVAAELAAKSVELFRELLPAARRIAALTNVSDPFSKPFLEKIRSAGEASGTQIETVAIRGPDELDSAFAAMDKNRPDALIVQASLGPKRPTELALQHRMPSASFFREFAEQGGLMSYAPADADVYRRAAIFVDKILKGAKPADLPVEQPTKFELVINMKTAKALGLTVPPAFVARADDIIE